MKRLAVACAPVAFTIAACSSGSTLSSPSTESAAPTIHRSETPSPICTDAFEVALASNAHGQPTPLAAATWFAVHDGLHGKLPRGGWRVVFRHSTSASMESGGAVVEVIQVPDKTWLVDQGSYC